jgi:hypothetical protein
VIDKAGIQDSGLLLATASGVLIGSHTVPRNPVLSFLSSPFTSMVLNIDAVLRISQPEIGISPAISSMYSVIRAQSLYKGI